MRRTALVLGAVLACGCSGGNVARELATAPEFDPEGQTKCKVKKSQSKPLIVEWPSAERVDLEVGRKQGSLVVRYDGCEMQLLTRCKAPGSYGYQAVAQKHGHATPESAARFLLDLFVQGDLEPGVSDAFLKTVPMPGGEGERATALRRFAHAVVTLPEFHLA